MWSFLPPLIYLFVFWRTHHLFIPHNVLYMFISIIVSFLLSNWHRTMGHHPSISPAITIHPFVHPSHTETPDQRGLLTCSSNAPLLSPSHSNGRALAFYPDTLLLSGFCHLDQWHVPPLLSTHLACLLYVSNTQRSRRGKKRERESWEIRQNGGNTHTVKVFYILHIHLLN